MAERAIEYQVLQNKADTGFLVKAPSLQRLYIDAALILTDMQTKLDRISDTEKQTLVVAASSRDALMLGWLNEVLSLGRQKQFLPRRIVFDLFDGKRIRATLWGQTYNALKHGALAEFKMVTDRHLEIGDCETPELHFFARVFLVGK